MIDIFDKIGEVSHLDEGDIREKFGTNLPTVQKNNSSKLKYGKDKKKSNPEPKGTPKNLGTSEKQDKVISNSQKN